MNASASPLTPRVLAPRVLATLAFLCFAPVVVSFSVAPGAFWADYPAILFHIALFLLVAGLHAPDWGRAAG